MGPSDIFLEYLALEGMSWVVVDEVSGESYGPSNVI